MIDSSFKMVNSVWQIQLPLICILEKKSILWIYFFFDGKFFRKNIVCCVLAVSASKDTIHDCIIYDTNSILLIWLPAGRVPAMVSTYHIRTDRMNSQCANTIMEGHCYKDIVIQHIWPYPWRLQAEILEGSTYYIVIQLFLSMNCIEYRNSIHCKKTFLKTSLLEHLLLLFRSTV